ncbi:hypothetical protein DOY81_012543 [Sarcophaga bullata]|nr:hypothetical protein DOY81_012543 [Sarcophaga bullata]
MDLKLFLFGLLLISLNLCFNTQAQRLIQQQLIQEPNNPQPNMYFSIFEQQKRNTNCGYKFNGKPIQC